MYGNSINMPIEGIRVNNGNELGIILNITNYIYIIIAIVFMIISIKRVLKNYNKKIDRILITLGIIILTTLFIIASNQLNHPLIGTVIGDERSTFSDFMNNNLIKIILIIPTILIELLISRKQKKLKKEETKNV